MTTPKASSQKKTANTVFFRYSPADTSITRKNFESFFSDIGPVKKCSLIRQNKNASAESSKRQAKGYGFCKFTMEEDAQQAAKSLNETLMKMEDGQKVKVWVELADAASSAKKEEDTPVSSSPKTEVEGVPLATSATETSEEILALQAKKRTSRVILRNLSFYATEHNIRQVMEKYGEVVDINLPLVPFQKDDSYQGKRRQQHRGFAFVTFAKQTSAQNAVDVCAGKEQVLIKKRAVAIDFSVSKFQHKRMKEEEDAKDHAGGDTDSESSDSDSDDDSSSDSDSDSGSGSEDDGSESEEEKDDDKDMADGEEKKVVEKDSHLNSLFLRNLPFDATRHDLFTLFAPYGHVAGIFLVRDRDTGIGKGTAFVKFSKEGGSIRALEAGGADAEAFKSGKNILGDNGSGGGLYLNGRRIFVDLAVDKGTADTLKVERDDEGKPIGEKIGKDRRNLYLKGEGRVENNEDSGSHDPNSWEHLPQSDQLKRGRAHQEKSTKLRSPLFFINPYRLSIRNLSKQIDEKEFKQLMMKGIVNGLKKNLVTKDDMIAHWRASGEMETRGIVEKLAVCEKEGNLIPTFDEKRIKNYVPSVFIDRDFDATTKPAEKGKGEKVLAPSRGFGFAEFTEHAHAMACLRELNNSTEYSSEFVSGGKRAQQMKSNRSTKRKKPKKDSDVDDGPSGQDFIGEDGKIRVPRLLVEFTVENKAKARKQAENKAQQLENAQKQKLSARAAAAGEDGEKPKKKKKQVGRGAQQRAKKRKMIEDGILDKDGNKIEDPKKKKSKPIEKGPTDAIPQEKKKEIQPKKKPRKVDKEERNFEDMVRTYKKSFAADIPEKEKEAAPNPREEVSENRWFD
eukprot:scaffold6789_cov217-Chaetoceros_neogracile.AAC.3